MPFPTRSRRYALMATALPFVPGAVHGAGLSVTDIASGVSRTSGD